MTLQSGRISEKSINDKLGDILRTLNPRWKEKGRIVTENTRVLGEGAGLQPDIVIVHPGGVPVLIETEFTPAQNLESKDARPRLGKTLERNNAIVEHVIALRIPKTLASTDQAKLSEAVSNTKFEFCLIFEPTLSNNVGRWPKKGWIEGGVKELATFIEHTALSENKIERGMNVLVKGVEQAAYELHQGSTNTNDVLKKIARELHQEDGEQTSRMAMAIIANALSFHTTLSGTRGVKTLDELKLSNDRGIITKGRIVDEWIRIRNKINYWPIFDIALKVLAPIRNGTAEKILARLASVASELDSLGTTSQHDLSGRMFQRLISDRKFLATFYTRPASAALLAEIAVSRLNLDWSNSKQISKLRVADFACGTGALLNAGYHSMMSRFRRSGGDDKQIHAKMIENVLVGTDIMPAATHLTTSILSSVHPTQLFGGTQIVTLKYGEIKDKNSKNKEVFIGALDLIEESSTTGLFPTDQTYHSGTMGNVERPLDIPHEAFDLIIMNPPFTRSTGQEADKIGVPVPSFAGFQTSEDEQFKMSEKLQRIQQNRKHRAGHQNAGLATNFMDVADVKIKEGGVIALVVPATVVSGKAWARMRNLLNSRYSNLVVVSIACSQPGETAFSADTAINEVLIIATRSTNSVEMKQDVKFVNIDRRPESIIEAVEYAKEIVKSTINKNHGTLSLGTEQTFGYYTSGTLGNGSQAGIGDWEVAESIRMLSKGFVKLPRMIEEFDIPITNLEILGNRGPYHQDIDGIEQNKFGVNRGPFKRDKLNPGAVPTYPILWTHNTKTGRENSLIVEPDCQGIPRDQQEEKAIKLWTKHSTHLCFNRDFGFGSQSLGACYSLNPVLGGHAWPGFKCNDRRYDKPLVLWMNTTLGLMTFWYSGTRQQLGRSRLTISQLPRLRVLDISKFTNAQFDKANKIFDEYKNKKFLPAARANVDELRKSLDERVLLDLLGFPAEITRSINLLREKWCAEPSIHRTSSKKPQSG